MSPHVFHVRQNSCVVLRCRYTRLPIAKFGSKISYRKLAGISCNKMNDMHHIYFAVAIKKENKWEILIRPRVEPAQTIRNQINASFKYEFNKQYAEQSFQ